MKNTTLSIIGTVLALMGSGLYIFFGHIRLSPFSNQVSIHVPENINATSSVPTERFSARIDRVDVVFEQTDYTTYSLQTNGLIRTGGMNSERGYGTDPDATVYVLNWQEEVGKQIRFVRLTAEPDHLYYLDSENKIIKGNVLTKN